MCRARVIRRVMGKPVRDSEGAVLEDDEGLEPQLQLRCDSVAEATSLRHLLVFHEQKHDHCNISR